MREQIASISAAVEYAVISLFGNACRATESSPDKKVIAVIQTVVKTALAKGLQIFAYYLAMEDAVYKFMPEPMNVDAVVVKLIDSPAFTVRVVKSMKDKIEKKPLGKTKMEEPVHKAIQDS